MQHLPDFFRIELYLTYDIYVYKFFIVCAKSAAAFEKKKKKKTSRPNEEENECWVEARYEYIYIFFLSNQLKKEWTYVVTLYHSKYGRCK